MDNPVLVGLVWYPLLLFFAILLHRQTRCFSHWNIFTLLGGLLILFHGLYVPFSLDINYRIDGGQVADSVKLTYLINVMVAFFTMTAGAWAANKTQRFSIAETGETPLPQELPAGLSITRIWIAVLVMVVVGLYVESQSMGGIGLMDMLRGKVDVEQYKMSRFMFNRSTSGEKGIIFYFARIMFISWMLLFIGVTYWMYRAGRRYGGLLFGTLSLLYLHHAVMSGHKAPIAYYLLTVFACHSMSKQQRSFRKFIPLVLCLFVILFFLLLPLQYMLQYSFITYGEALESALFRLAIEPNRCLILYYDTFPGRFPHTGLSSIPLVAKLLGLDIAIPAHTYIPLFEHGQIGQTWNVAFFGDAWVGFGMLGTIFFSFFVGYFLQRINIWHERSEKTLLKSGLYVCLIIAASRLSATSLPSALMTFGLGTYFLVYFGLKSAGPVTRKIGRISMVRVEPEVAG